MEQSNKTYTTAGIAGKHSVDIVLDLLRITSNKSNKRRRNEESEHKDKAPLHCLINLLDKRSKNAALGFSENHAISEMRSCLARHDWSNLQELFPHLLGCYSEIEPIVWRHALAILLCTPNSDSAYLQEFLEMCIGAQTLEDNDLLERLLTLKNKDS